MKLQIKYSRTSLIEIEINPTASIKELMQQVYKYDESAHKDLITLDAYAASTLLLSQNQWLEDIEDKDDKHLLDYSIHPGQIIDLISLRFDAEKTGPEQHHIPDEFVCQLTGEVFYQPMLLPSGVSVEKQYIDKWLSEHTKCPFTGSPLSSNELIENDPLKEKLMRLTQKYTILEDIVTRTQYQNKNLPGQSRVSGPIEPDANDRLAIARAAASEFFWSRSTGFTMFSPQFGPSVVGESLLSNMLAIDLIQASYRLAVETLYTMCIYHVLMSYVFALRAVARGFTLPQPSREVSALSQQCIEETIIALQYYDVTADLIRQYWRPIVSTTAWLNAEKWALIYLVTGSCSGEDSENLLPLPTELRLTPTQALREMTRLHDGYALSTLKRLHRYGLMGEHLRQWRNDQGNNILEREHHHALVFLIEEECMPPAEAIRRIDSLSADAASAIEQTIFNSNRFLS